MSAEPCQTDMSNVKVLDMDAIFSNRFQKFINYKLQIIYQTEFFVCVEKDENSWTERAFFNMSMWWCFLWVECSHVFKEYIPNQEFSVHSHPCLKNYLLGCHGSIMKQEKKQAQLIFRLDFFCLPIYFYTSCNFPKKFLSEIKLHFHVFSWSKISLKSYVTGKHL